MFKIGDRVKTYWLNEDNWAKGATINLSNKPGKIVSINSTENLNLVDFEDIPKKWWAHQRPSKEWWFSDYELIRI